MRAQAAIVLRGQGGGDRPRRRRPCACGSKPGHRYPRELASVRRDDRTWDRSASTSALTALRAARATRSPRPVREGAASQHDPARTTPNDFSDLVRPRETRRRRSRPKWTLLKSNQDVRRRSIAHIEKGVTKGSRGKRSRSARCCAGHAEDFFERKVAAFRAVGGRHEGARLV